MRNPSTAADGFRKSSTHPTNKLIRARDAELDRFLERLLHGRGRKQRQRILGDRSVVARTLDRVLERAVLGHQADRMLEIGLARIAVLQRAAPKRAFGLRAA